MAEKIREVDPKGMLIGVSTTPGCWKNPMDAHALIEEEENEKEKE